MTYIEWKPENQPLTHIKETIMSKSIGGPGCDSFEGTWCNEHGGELPGEECGERKKRQHEIDKLFQNQNKGSVKDFSIFIAAGFFVVGSVLIYAIFLTRACVVLSAN